jgi:hypothetical protein
MLNLLPRGWLEHCLCQFCSSGVLRMTFPTIFLVLVLVVVVIVIVIVIRFVGSLVLR